MAAAGSSKHDLRFLLLPAAILSAAGVYYILQTRKRKSEKSMEAGSTKLSTEIILDRSHINFLEKMAAKYKLPDTGKALRIVITYASQEAPEALVFDKVRCVTCGKKDKQSVTFKLENRQLEYLHAAVAKHKVADVSKGARALLDYVMGEGDEEAIFGIKRCAHGATCDSCK